MEPSNQKVGAYPNADLPNLFGTFYSNFYTALKAQGNPEPDCQAAYGIANAHADQKFLEAIKEMEIDWDNLRPPMMNRIMHQCLALTVRLQWYTYKQVPRSTEGLPDELRPRV